MEAEHLHHLQLEAGPWQLLEQQELEEAGSVQESVEAPPAAAVVAVGCFSGPAWPPADSSEPPSAVGKSAGVAVAEQPVVVVAAEAAAAAVAVGQQKLTD